MLLSLLLCLLALFYSQAGYAMLMWALARLFPHPIQPSMPAPEALTIILCVHNGAARIRQRLSNLLDCEWSGNLEILVFCDGCQDETAELVRQMADPRVSVLEAAEQRGKWAALNEAVVAARHPFLIFADLRQTFDRLALRELAEPFRDPRVGAVSGLLDIAASADGGGRGVDLYWKMERKLREWEGCIDSVIGCTGAIYAIRREAFRPLAPATILDDVIVPMQIAVQGWRVLYRPTAIAYDPQTLDPAKEKQRKTRTLVGNYQMLERHPEWLLPWRNRLWWQLLSHKYARLAAPWLMLAILILTLVMPKTPMVWFLLGGQGLCYGLGLLGSLMPRLRSKLVTIPSGFLLLQITCALALLAYWRTRRDPLILWKPGQAEAKPKIGQ